MAGKLVVYPLPGLVLINSAALLTGWTIVQPLRIRPGLQIADCRRQLGVIRRRSHWHGGVSRQRQVHVTIITGPLRCQIRQQPICDQDFLMPQSIKLLAGRMAGSALGMDAFDQLLVLLARFNLTAQIIKTLVVQIGCCELRSLMLH